MFDADGKLEKEISFPNRNVYYVVGDDVDGSGKNSYCSLVGTTSGDNIAMGISLDGKELWNYTLPVGVHARPIEVIGTGDLTGDCWETVDYCRARWFDPYSRGRRQTGG